MRKSLQTFGLSVFIVVAVIVIIIGLLPGMNPWVSVVAVGVLIALPLIHKQLTARRFVAWRDDLSVGIQAVDDDHKNLLHLINNLQTAVYYPTGETFERQALEELVAYTKYHFEREEQLMEANGYPDFANHKREHEAMIAKVGDFLAEYEKDREATVERLTEFLKTWLINHIQGTDQKYSPYLKSKGVS